MTKIVNSKSNKYFTKFGQLSARNYFGMVVKGQPKVWHTPFAKGETTNELLDGWQTILESIHGQWPSLYDFEMDMRSKVGPMSVMKPLKQRMSDINAYYDGILLPSQPISDQALDEVRKEYAKLRGLRIRSQERTVDLMKKSTNSGNPYFTKRRNVVNKTLPVDLNLYEMKQFISPEDTMWDVAAILGWRGQEGGPNVEDVKQRVVWMFPFAVNICELQCYQPLIEAAQNFNLIPAWVSMESVDKQITKMMDSKSSNDLIVCTDFTKFDQHFNPDMSNAAQSILQYILTSDAVSYSWLTDVFPMKYEIPIMYNYGMVKRGKHGMGSGSGGTNVDETLAHRALQYEAAMYAHSKLNPFSQCLGDDGILTYPGITVEDVVESYQRHGQEMNESKQYASTQDCVYLRRWHHDKYRQDGTCVGVYSTMRALGRLRYLERFQDPKYWDEKAVALRQLSIIENVKYHPLKDKFVDYCMVRDKYRLGIDIPHFLDDVAKIAKEKIEHMPDFLGYTKTLQSGSDPTGGIANWWVVRYLKSRR